MSGPALSLERRGELGHLVLDRPPRNTTDLALFGELERLVAEVLPGLPLRGLVLRGRSRHFSSGADLDELRAWAGAPGAAGRVRRHGACLERLGRLPYPVVAAISGCCLGSGLELALACTLRVAAEGAVLALPEAQHGLMPGCGGTVRLTRLLGVSRAVELLLGGRALLADEALAAGLVDRVVPRQELVASAEALALAAGTRS